MPELTCYGRRISKLPYPHPPLHLLYLLFTSLSRFLLLLLSLS